MLKSFVLKEKRLLEVLIFEVTFCVSVSGKLYFIISTEVFDLKRNLNIFEDRNVQINKFASKLEFASTFSFVSFFFKFQSETDAYFLHCKILLLFSFAIE